ncbi:RraA family protein [uncultured Oscillibacter sp.]|uniref:RraA family protein n=1 Tax=uncultured Oscillibacter sp. TaxID=876091 RepID=UPI0026167112|nr:RraA family protein [uncultured Oscillibacter sp.]
MAIGCRIETDFKRAAPRLVALFQGIPVANIDDNMGRVAAMDSRIFPLGKGQLLGTAFTVRVPQGDNLMFHAAMDLARPGDVIMIDAGGFDNRAIFGELMAAYCKRRGIAGIVCDGAVRDSAALSRMEGFLVYACGVTPNGPYKNGPGEIGVPVVIGGKAVHPGDIIVGDEDGVLAIDPAAAEELAAAAAAVQEKEDAIMRHIVEDGAYIRPWVDGKLREIGCAFPGQ